MSDSVDLQLVQPAMRMALHCGVQSAAEDFQYLLDNNKVVCSMARKGNCWNNTYAESFLAV